MINKKQVGKKYEDIATSYLKNNGYIIIERNFWTRYGEIDIIAKNDNYICFIEVKYRKGKEFATGLEAVDKKKQKIIYNVAKFYLYINKYNVNTACRFDVISIDGNKITLIKDAFP